MVTAYTGVIIYLYMSDIVYCLQIQHCVADIPNLASQMCALQLLCVERQFVRTTTSYFENKPLMMYQQT